MIINDKMTEYDIQHAGPSILVTYGRITRKEYENLISLPKKQRVVQTGLMIKEDKTLYDDIQRGYKEYTTKLIEENNILPEQVLEINHDAVWVHGVVPKKCKFGEVVFRKKKRFSIMWLYDKKNIRIYYEPLNDEIFIRGSKFNDNDFLKKELTEILKMYDRNQHKLLYYKLHKLKLQLKENKISLGDDLIPGISNVKMINKLIHDLL